MTLAVFSQEGTRHEVDPKGVYKEIDLKNELKIINKLQDSNYVIKHHLVDSIEHNANYYAPPVLYYLSHFLFLSNKMNEAIYWFYVAQLRARYDVNRCTDKTATATAYNSNFGPDINQYAFTHIDSLEKIIPKVVDYVRSNEEHYDQRWINLTGMQAMITSLGDNANNGKDEKKLSFDKSEWPAIKEKTINDYYGDFKTAMANLKKK
jgi:hypothetical protein